MYKYTHTVPRFLWQYSSLNVTKKLIFVNCIRHLYIDRNTLRQQFSLSRYIPIYYFRRTQLCTIYDQSATRFANSSSSQHVVTTNIFATVTNFTAHILLLRIVSWATCKLRQTHTHTHTHTDKHLPLGQFYRLCSGYIASCGDG